ncbi:MAG: 1,4-dihydroxy-2-naphthoate octaprenyltransferase [Halorubrum sp. J07HR59]|nr:MAG: 1,4-dihydroxy-2-naphthoate octaprenyltransferase [Halorubrum sp. J07HR59]
MSESGRLRIVTALWRMSRPAQIALIILVYALGVAMAVARGGPVQPDRVGLGLAALLPIAASVHYANEYADVETDALAERTPFSGGSGALPDTGLPARLASRAALVSGAVGLAVLVAVVSPLASRPLGVIPAALLVGILLVGWQYSVGPLRLAWHGFGEVTNAALGGVALPLYGFAVVTGEVTLQAMLATVPFALAVFVNLLETQWPDRRADATVGKRTLATRWSAGRLRLVYGLASIAAIGTAIALSGGVLPRPVAIGTAVPMLGFGPGYIRFTRREKPFPAVMTMVTVAVGSTAGWSLVVAGALVDITP